MEHPIKLWFVVLACLKKGGMRRLDIVETITDEFNWFCHDSNVTKALAFLLEQKFITVVERSPKNKKYYMTDSGKALLIRHLKPLQAVLNERKQDDISSTGRETLRQSA